LTVERNSNIKYTPPAIHGQKRKGQQTLPPLPNTLPARVQVKLSDYAPLENPEKALALALRLKEIQERGEEVLLITRNEELEELNRMRATTTDGEHEDGDITTPLVIPEIDELERRLAGVPEKDMEGKRTVIREWVRGLHGTGALKPLDEKGHTRRRYINEVAAETAIVQEWVKQLDKILDPLAGETIHISGAASEYNLNHTIIMNWKKQGILVELDKEKNRVLIEAKGVTNATIVNRRFATKGSRVVNYAMGFFKSINPM